MPAARGVKRTASKASAATASTGPKNKKKRGAIQLEIPSAPKKRGRVLACGQGDVGQLGLGEDVVETTKFKHVAALGDKIVEVCAGGMHTIALDTDGKVWTFGCNDEGALGRATSGEREEGAPRAVPLPRAAVAVAAGDSHSAALLDDGAVYAWGAFRDSHGSMGLVVRGREGKACREPVKVDIGEQAVGIASGGDHLVILSTSGAVYTMGCGEQGQLGRLSQRSASRDARQGFSALLVPSKVTLKSGISRVWAGYHATFALDAAAGKLFAWGLNNYGQLGITGEKRKTAVFSPTECDAFSGGGGGGGGWARVAPGQHHSLALDSRGTAYAIGRCEYGRLGLGDRAGDAEVLEPIPKLQSKRCISIAAGTSNSFAVTDTGEVFAWGMGSEGQLGTGASADAAEPTAALLAAAGGRTPLHISAGGQHTVLLVEDLTPLKESSPVPEKEEAEEKVESVEEEPAKEKEKEREKTRKRPRKHEQDEEISSTSSAQPARTTEDKPQKLNGKDKVDTPMDVDETDKPQDKEDEEETKTDDETKADEHSNKDTETEHTESDKDDTMDTCKPDTMDTCSQDTAASDTTPKPDTDTKRDTEMDTDTDKSVNGTPDTNMVDAKPVDNLVPTDTALTTSA